MCLDWSYPSKLYKSDKTKEQTVLFSLKQGQILNIQTESQSGFLIAQTKELAFLLFLSALNRETVFLPD